MEILRFTTAGSVNDGKSTLIGRLLSDAQLVYKDQIEKVEQLSRTKGFDHTDFSLFTDGLKDEIEMGITIDVAYRYFRSKRRKFIIADSPGHFEYTRNMFTAASTADLSLILINATKGLVEQTYRHCHISSLLGISQMVVCINKMDLVDYQQHIYEELKLKCAKLIEQLGVPNVQFIPISALNGDNVVSSSAKMTWYDGATLLHHLEEVNLSSKELGESVLPVQNVLEMNTQTDQSGKLILGRLASGALSVGDEVVVLPSNTHTQIASLHQLDKPVGTAIKGMSITVGLKSDQTVHRGDILVSVNNQPNVANEVDVMLCWLSSDPPQMCSEYLVMHCHQLLKGRIEELHYVLDNGTGEKDTESTSFGMNDIVKVSLKLSSPIVKESYKVNKTLGSCILIDQTTNKTLAAAVIE